MFHEHLWNGIAFNLNKFYGFDREKMFGILFSLRIIRIEMFSMRQRVTIANRATSHTTDKRNITLKFENENKTRKHFLLHKFSL